MNLANYSNLTLWVKDLDKKIEAILVKRLEEAIHLWNAMFTGDKANAENAAQLKRAVRARARSNSRSTPSEDVNESRCDAFPEMKTSVHELLIRNQIMQLEPPVEHARCATG